MRRRNYTYEIYLLMGAFCVLILTQTAYAQFKKGDRFLGGSFQFKNNSSRNVNGEQGFYIKDADLSISPVYGKFLTDKLAIGIELSYVFGFRNQYQQDQYPEKYFYQWYQPGLFLRRYFPMGKTIGFILDGGINYQFFQSKWSDYYLNRENISKSNEHSVMASVTPVFVFFPTPLLGFEVSPGGFNYSLGLSSGGLNTHSFQLVYGGLNMGLNYYFRKKEKATVVEG